MMDTAQEQINVRDEEGKVCRERYKASCCFQLLPSQYCDVFTNTETSPCLLFFGYAACGILVPQPGIEPASSALEMQSLHH